MGASCTVATGVEEGGVSRTSTQPAMSIVVRDEAPHAALRDEVAALRDEVARMPPSARLLRAPSGHAMTTATRFAC